MPTELYIISLCIASIGAILGFLTFINQYLIVFKPKIFINNFLKIVLNNNNNNGTIEIENLILNLSISNSKNSFGVIEDISVGIYQTNEVRPKYNYVFPIGISENNNDYNTFSPIVLVPKSFKNVFIKFGSKFFEHCFIRNYEISFDIFCKYQNIKKWKKVERIHLYCFKDNQTDEMIYKILNFDISRDTLKKSNNNPFTDFYKGNFGKWLYFFKFNAIFILKSPFRITKDSLKTLFYLVKIILSNLIGKIIIEPIIINESNKFSTIKVEIVEADLYTIKSITKIAKIIKKKTLNKKIKNKINFKFENNKIYLSRNNYDIEIFPQGKSSIVTKSSNIERNVNFEFQYQRNVFGFKYWTIEKKLISKYRLSLKIFDYFCMFSS